MEWRSNSSEHPQSTESSLKTDALLLLGFKGRDRVNIVPPSGGQSTEILPSCLLVIISYEMLSPSPVPSPGFLVVKNGENILSLIASGIPGPSSLMEQNMQSSPGHVLIVIFPGLLFFCDLMA